MPSAATIKIIGLAVSKHDFNRLLHDNNIALTNCYASEGVALFWTSVCCVVKKASAQ